jgi:putative membrane protein
VDLLHVPGSGASWSAWSLEPSVIFGAAVVLALYAIGVRSVAASDAAERAVLPRRAASFAVGVALIVLALISPLDALTDDLLSLHMLQHVVLATLAPPFVILGLPPSLVRWLMRRGAVDRAVRLLTLPFVAAALFIVNMWAWHAPPLYEAALHHESVHIGQHLTFIATGLLFWWPIIEPVAERASMGIGGRLLYVFVTGFPMGVLALLLISAQSPAYDFYADREGLWGISPLADQQIAGLIMGSIGEGASFVAFTVLFLRFMASEEEVVSPAPPGAVLR